VRLSCRLEFARAIAIDLRNMSERVAAVRGTQVRGRIPLGTAISS
jgi:hypothetical protein